MFRRENEEAGKVLRYISLLRCYYIAMHKILTCSTVCTSSIWNGYYRSSAGYRENPDDIALTQQSRKKQWKSLVIFNLKKLYQFIIGKFFLSFWLLPI